jgi:hypothetical protein
MGRSPVPTLTNADTEQIAYSHTAQKKKDQDCACENDLTVPGNSYPGRER